LTNKEITEITKMWSCDKYICNDILGIIFSNMHPYHIKNIILTNKTFMDIVLNNAEFLHNINKNWFGKYRAQSISELICMANEFYPVDINTKITHNPIGYRTVMKYLDDESIVNLYNKWWNIESKKWNMTKICMEASNLLNKIIYYNRLDLLDLLKDIFGNAKYMRINPKYINKYIIDGGDMNLLLDKVSKYYSGTLQKDIIVDYNYTHDIIEEYNKYPNKWMNCEEFAAGYNRDIQFYHNNNIHFTSQYGHTYACGLLLSLHNKEDFHVSMGHQEDIIFLTNGKDGIYCTYETLVFAGPKYIIKECFSIKTGRHRFFSCMNVVASRRRYAELLQWIEEFDNVCSFIKSCTNNTRIGLSNNQSYYLLYNYGIKVL
ncbi:Hypothetical protein ORPV_157, partial [Orpheovirus IHUMI-LCC2]